MATVIQVPGDRRFGAIGEALGTFVGAQIARGREEEKEEERRQAYASALGIVQEVAAGDIAPTAQQFTDISTNLSKAGAQDQVPQFVDMISDLRSERAKQESRTASQQAVQQLAKEEPQVAATLVPGQTVPQALNIASIRASLRKDAKPVGKRELTIFTEEGDQKTILVPSTANQEQVQGIIDKDHPGFSLVKRKLAPITPAAKPTETDKRIKDVLIRRGIEKPTASDKANARNLVEGRKGVNQELAGRFAGTIIEDRFGNLTASFEGKEKERTQYSLALGLADDILFSGVDPNDAVNQAEEEARIQFSTGTFIPERIRRAGPEAVRQFLEQRRIVAPEVVRYFVDLQTARVPANATPERVEKARQAYRRAVEVLNPFITEAQLSAAVDKRYPPEQRRSRSTLDRGPR